MWNKTPFHNLKVLSQNLTEATEEKYDTCQDNRYPGRDSNSSKNNVVA
jgi:hypothetical protein